MYSLLLKIHFPTALQPITFGVSATVKHPVEPAVGSGPEGTKSAAKTVEAVQLPERVLKVSNAMPRLNVYLSRCCNVSRIEKISTIESISKTTTDEARNLLWHFISV